MDFSRHFVSDPGFAFLNAGTLSRTPLRVLEAMERLRREEERNPTKSSFASVGVFWRAQTAVAEFLGADAEDLFLRSNITTALNDFLFALPLEGEEEILATGMEYGATANLARQRAEQAGWSFRAAPLPLGPDVTAAELATAVLDAIGARTKVLVFSHVITGTGTILPVEEIGRAAQARGITVVVDGAHAIGSLPLQIAALPVDFYGGNLHKWFMGPKGTAFGWVHPRWRGRLEWRFGGWASFAKPAHYRDFGGSAEAARRLFPGTMDETPFAGLLETHAFWREFGADAIRTRQRALRDLAALCAEGIGWERVSPRDPALLGPLVSFRLPAAWRGSDGVTLATRIYREAKVQLALPVVQGEMVVRFSPGVYATEAEVREGIERLRNFV